MQRTKKESRKRIHMRIRKKISGTPERPRLCVFRSNKSFYCQLIDDTKGHTIAAADSVNMTGPGLEQAKAVGKLIAERAQAAGVTDVVFDRGGYLYHGRIQVFADSAREGGLKF